MAKKELSGREAKRQADLDAAKKKLDDANAARDERIANRKAAEARRAERDKGK